MGTIFEELVRRFNEENNEEAGEHWTPRDAVKLMAKLIFPIADDIESGTYLLYDGACGTGGMLTVAEETLNKLAKRAWQGGRHHLFGQEINAETYAICKADLLLKGEGDAADNIVGGPEHSTLSPTTPSVPRVRLHALQSALRQELEDRPGAHGRQEGIKRPALRHRAQRRPEFSLITRSSDGQMLFLANKLQDEAQHAAGQPHRRGSQRLIAVHRRRRPGREQHPPLDHRERLAGSHRRAAAEHVLQHRHRHLHLGAHQPQARTPQGQGPAHRRHQMVQPLRKNLGKKNCELRLAIHVTPGKLAAFKKDAPAKLHKAADLLAGIAGGSKPHLDFNAVQQRFASAMKKADIKLRAPDLKALYAAFTFKDEAAEPVIKKKTKDAVEYEPDTDLRDTEQVPLLEDGGIEAFFQREVLPHVPDAWIDHAKTQIGYEISFTRHFYKPTPLRSLDEIKADLEALQAEAEGLLDEIVAPAGGKA
jgi:type I restriction enzyme M protein